MSKSIKTKKSFFGSILGSDKINKIIKREKRDLWAERKSLCGALRSGTIYNDPESRLVLPEATPNQDLCTILLFDPVSYSDFSEWEKNRWRREMEVLLRRLFNFNLTFYQDPTIKDLEFYVISPTIRYRHVLRGFNRFKLSLRSTNPRYGILHSIRNKLKDCYDEDVTKFIRLIDQAFYDRGMIVLRFMRACKWLKLAKMTKTRAFCEWFYAPDNIGGMQAKSNLQKLVQ
jgi:hypothetical protein